MLGPLSGITVVDLSINVLGPLATQILGDMGADVIKIEQPGGDPTRRAGASRNSDMSAFFLNVNRNKRSVVLDLKNAEARSALIALTARADVFVHNMRAGAAKRLGIDYDSIRAVRPDIVHAVGGGFRKGGPRADRPAFDDVIQGMSGLAALNGRASGGAPTYVPMVMVDKICGMALASAIGMALFHRAQTGRGQAVHLPMFETMVGFNMVEHFWFGALAEPQRGVGYPRLLTPHRRPYPTMDGHVCVMASTDSQWQRLYDVLGVPELADDPRFSTHPGRTTHIDTLYGIVAERLRLRPTAEWLKRLDEVDIPNGPVDDLESLAADPYLHETGFYRPVQHPTEGPLMMMANPVDFSDSPESLRRLPPRLGEHTQSVLAALGLSDEQIRAIAG